MSSNSDNEYLQNVQNFLQTIAPAAMTAQQREVLQQLVQAFSLTSQDFQMQCLVADLHYRYDITDMIEPVYLNRLLFYVNQSHESNIAMQQQIWPSTPTQQSQYSSIHSHQDFTLPQPSTFQPLPLSLPTPEAIQPSEQSVAIQASQGTLGQVTKCHPLGLIRQITVARTCTDWLFICDLCGHGVTRREEFVRHERVGAQRIRFKLVSVTPESDHKWYGQDSAGNEYIGDMVPSASSKQYRPRVLPAPCGNRLKAHKARLLQAKKGSREKATETAETAYLDGADDRDFQDAEERWDQMC